MGRKRTINHDLPPRMNLKGKSYYHVSTDTPRKWTKLGQDLVIAKRLWAEIEGEPIDRVNSAFSSIAARYRKEVFLTKAPQTQPPVSD